MLEQIGIIAHFEVLGVDKAVKEVKNFKSIIVSLDESLSKSVSNVNKHFAKLNFSSLSKKIATANSELKAMAKNIDAVASSMLNLMTVTRKFEGSSDSNFFSSFFKALGDIKHDPKMLSGIRSIFKEINFLTNTMKNSDKTGVTRTKQIISTMVDLTTVLGKFSIKPENVSSFNSLKQILKIIKSLGVSSDKNVINPELVKSFHGFVLALKDIIRLKSSITVLERLINLVKGMEVQKLKVFAFAMKSLSTGAGNMGGMAHLRELSKFMAYVSRYGEGKLLNLRKFFHDFSKISLGRISEEISKLALGMGRLLAILKAIKENSFAVEFGKMSRFIQRAGFQKRDMWETYVGANRERKFIPSEGVFSRTFFDPLRKSAHSLLGRLEPVADRLTNLGREMFAIRDILGGLNFQLRKFFDTAIEGAKNLQLNTAFIKFTAELNDADLKKYKDDIFDLSEKSYFDQAEVSAGMLKIAQAGISGRTTVMQGGMSTDRSYASLILKNALDWAMLSKGEMTTDQSASFVIQMMNKMGIDYKNENFKTILDSQGNTVTKLDRITDILAKATTVGMLDFKDLPAVWDSMRTTFMDIGKDKVDMERNLAEFLVMQNMLKGQGMSARQIGHSLNSLFRVLPSWEKSAEIMFIRQKLMFENASKKGGGTKALTNANIKQHMKAQGMSDEEIGQYSSEITRLESMGLSYAGRGQNTIKFLKEYFGSYSHFKKNVLMDEKGGVRSIVDIYDDITKAIIKHKKTPAGKEVNLLEMQGAIMGMFGGLVPVQTLRALNEVNFTAESDVFRRDASTGTFSAMVERYNTTTKKMETLNELLFYKDNEIIRVNNKDDKQKKKLLGEGYKYLTDKAKLQELMDRMKEDDRKLLEKDFRLMKKGEYAGVKTGTTKRAFEAMINETLEAEVTRKQLEAIDKTYAGAVKKLSKSFSNLKIEIIYPIMEKLSVFFNFLSGAMDKITRTLKENPRLKSALASVLSLFGMVILPLLTGFMALVVPMAFISKEITTVKGIFADATWKKITGFLGNITGVAKAGEKLVMTKLPTKIPALSLLKTTAVKGASSLFTPTKSFIKISQPFFGEITGFWNKVGSIIKSPIQSVFKAGGSLGNVLKNLSSRLALSSNAIVRAGGQLSKFFGTILKFVSKFGGFVAKIGVSMILFEVLSPLLETVFDSVAEFLKGIFGSILTQGQSALYTIQQLMAKVRLFVAFLAGKEEFSGQDILKYKLEDDYKMWAKYFSGGMIGQGLVGDVLGNPEAVSYLKQIAIDIALLATLGKKGVLVAGAIHAGGMISDLADKKISMAQWSEKYSWGKVGLAIGELMLGSWGNPILMIVAGITSLVFLVSKIVGWMAEDKEELGKNAEQLSYGGIAGLKKRVIEVTQDLSYVNPFEKEFLNKDTLSLIAYFASNRGMPVGNRKELFEVLNKYRTEKGAKGLKALIGVEEVPDNWWQNAFPFEGGRAIYTVGMYNISENMQENYRQFYEASRKGYEGTLKQFLKDGILSSGEIKELKKLKNIQTELEIRYQQAQLDTAKKQMGMAQVYGTENDKLEARDYLEVIEQQLNYSNPNKNSKEILNQLGWGRFLDNEDEVRTFNYLAGQDLQSTYSPIAGMNQTTNQQKISAILEKNKERIQSLSVDKLQELASIININVNQTTGDIDNPDNLANKIVEFVKKETKSDVKVKEMKKKLNNDQTKPNKGK